MQNYKFLNHIVLWNVFFVIICIPTAGKLIDVMEITILDFHLLFSFRVYFFRYLDRSLRLCGRAAGFVVLHLRAAFDDRHFRICDFLSSFHCYDEQSIVH